MGTAVTAPALPVHAQLPKGVSLQKPDSEPESTAVFSVVGMTCAACAGSVEKAVKRLPGIREALVDVLNNRAQVFFFPSFVNEETIREAIEDCGFEAALLPDDVNDKSVQYAAYRLKE
ncbi:putative copper-transporting ATPase [Arachis hypogaea]|nr:putative copper-transporting ATPase [Arachis hypogaea]